MYRYEILYQKALMTIETLVPVKVGSILRIHQRAGCYMGDLFVERDLGTASSMEFDETRGVMVETETKGPWVNPCGVEPCHFVARRTGEADYGQQRLGDDDPEPAIMAVVLSTDRYAAHSPVRNLDLRTFAR